MSDGVKAVCVGLAVLVGSHLYQTGSLKIPSIPNIAPAPTGELAKLVSPEDAAKAGAFYRAFSVVVSNGGCVTLADFRDAQKRGVALLKSTGKVGDASPLSEPVEKRLVAVVGLDDAALDPAKRAALAAELAAIATELGG